MEELRGLLVLADLPQGHSARTVPVGLLHSSSRRGGFASSLGGHLLPWSLASGGLAGGLLGASHVERGGRCDVNRERGRRVYSRMEFTAEEAEEDDPIDPDVVPQPDVSIPGVALGAAAKRFPPFRRTKNRLSNLEARTRGAEKRKQGSRPSGGRRIASATWRPRATRAKRTRHSRPPSPRWTAAQTKTWTTKIPHEAKRENHWYRYWYWYSNRENWVQPYHYSIP